MGLSVNNNPLQIVPMDAVDSMVAAFVSTISANIVPILIILGTFAAYAFVLGIFKRSRYWGGSFGDTISNYRNR